MTYEGELWWCVCKNTCGRPNNTEKESISNKFYSTCGGVFVVSLKSWWWWWEKTFKTSISHASHNARDKKMQIALTVFRNKRIKYSAVVFFWITAVLQTIHDSLHPVQVIEKKSGANWKGNLLDTRILSE